MRDPNITSLIDRARAAQLWDGFRHYEGQLAREYALLRRIEQLASLVGEVTNTLDHVTADTSHKCPRAIRAMGKE